MGNYIIMSSNNAKLSTAVSTALPDETLAPDGMTLAFAHPSLADRALRAVLSPARPGHQLLAGLLVRSIIVAPALCRRLTTSALTAF